MELIFLGRGAAFNPKEGNNSAYFIDNRQLFLIDCGESIFERIKYSEILNDIDSVNVMITHTHSDHIGSLGTFVMYSYYQLKKPINIIIPEKAKYLLNIDQILSGFGCNKQMYNYVYEYTYDNKFNTFNNIKYIETKHCPDLASYGILFNTQKGIIYYSGDSCEIDTIKKIIASNQSIYKLYIDTTNDNFMGNPHLYIGIINDTIPEELKSHVYCMHLNNDTCIADAKLLGFNVVEIDKNIKTKLLIK